MALVVESGIMKVGNSDVFVIPKSLKNTFQIEKGEKVTMIVQDDGIFIPLRTRADVSALLRKYRKREQVMEEASKKREKGGNRSD